MLTFIILQQCFSLIISGSYLLGLSGIALTLQLVWFIFGDQIKCFLSIISKCAKVFSISADKSIVS